MNTHGNNWGGSPNSLETDDGELARLKRENTKLKKSINAISANYEELRKERIALEETQNRLCESVTEYIGFYCNQIKITKYYRAMHIRMLCNFSWLTRLIQPNLDKFDPNTPSAIKQATGYDFDNFDETGESYRVEYIDLTGLTLDEIKSRVAEIDPEFNLADYEPPIKF